VVMGPHTFNFAEAAQLAQEAGAALRVQSMEEGVRAAMQLTGDTAALAAAVEAASAFSSRHQGAAEKTARAVLALMARVA
jgi:3-deoxy-D-manno-octulosonic-acid transferase